MIDVDRARRETPGTRRVAHLNNAGAALPPACVTDAVVAHVRLEEQIGGYEAASAAAELVDRTYAGLARLLGCERTEVALTQSATAAWDLAFYALPFAPGQVILTGRSEYASNAIAMLQVAARTGVRIEVVDDDEHGQLDVEALERALAGGAAGPVALIALTHVPTQSGLVNPAAEVGRLAREYGVTYLLDACQSVGQLPVDVGDLRCDLLTATGRKFLRGPRGTGFLYVRGDLAARLEPPVLDLLSAEWTAPDRYEIRTDARRFETWERNVAGLIGLGVAIDYALDWGLPAVERRVVALADRLRTALAERQGVHVHDRGQRLCGIVTFTVDGVPPAEVVSRLRAAGVNTHTASASSARFDLPRRGLDQVVRASVHYYNDDADLRRLLDALPAPS